MNRQLPWLPILFLGLAISGITLAFYLKASIQTKNELVVYEAIDSQLDSVSSDVVRSINQYRFGLRGLASAIATVGFDKFNYDKQLAYFRSYDYKTQFSGAMGIGLIKVVKRAELHEFIQLASLDRRQEFQVKQLESPQDPLFIIQYIEPEDDNKPAVGLDIGSESNRRLAALRSAALNRAQLTGPITLVQSEQNERKGFLLLLPVFHQKIPDPNPQLAGWVYAPLLINELFTTISTVNRQFLVSIIDTASDINSPFFQAGPLEGNTETAYSRQLTKEVFGRTWIIRLTPTDAYIAHLNLENGQIVFWFTLGCTVVITLFLLLLSRLVKSELQKLNQRAAFANVVDNASDGIVGVDSNFTIQLWNDAARSFLGWQHTNVINQSITNWLTPAIAPEKLINTFKQVARGEAVKNLEFYYTDPQKGTMRHLAINISPIFHNSQFFGATLNVNDVTEIYNLQKQTEQNNLKLANEVSAATNEINRQLKFQKSVLDSSNSIIIACEQFGKVSLINHRAETLLGYRADELVGRVNVNTLIRSSMVAEDVTAIDFAKSLGDKAASIGRFSDRSPFTCNLVAKSGIEINVNMAIAPLSDDEVVGYVFIATDLTEKKRLEKNISLVEAALENVQDILLWVNLQGHIIKANSYAVSYLNKQAKGLIGQNIRELIQFEKRKSWQDLCEELRANKQHVFESSIQVANEPQIMLFSASLCTIDNEDFVFLSTTDISERLEKESVSESERVKASVASHVKTNFIANMSHELRTPLHGINGFLQLLELTQINELQRTYLVEAKLGVISMTQIVDEIMDVIAGEKNQLVQDKSDFLLDELLSEIGLLLYELAGSKPIEIHYKIAPNVPYMLHGDRQKFKRILINLGTNAVKYSRQGEVLIEFSVAPTVGINICLKVVVTDTGEGIEQEKLANIFNIFTQPKYASNRIHGGLGIGLTLANQYVIFLGGKMHVSSKIGVGSEFSFDVIMESPKTSKHSRLDFLSEKKINVLVVDDNPTSLAILSQIIKQLGWYVAEADNAEDALALFTSALESKESFDLALIDWKMPQIDGWELASMIRRSVPADIAPLLIMITAHSKDMLAEKFARSPDLLNGFLTKPVTRAQLIEAFYDAVAAVSSPGHYILKEEKPLLKIRILVVEDNPTNQVIAKALLESQGANVVLASGGNQALLELENGILPFDVVLMDIQMPGLDGYQTTARIRVMSKFKYLPIIAMTANVLLSDKDKCLAAGMNGHIGKPFELDDIVKQILSVTNSLKHQNLAVEKDANYRESDHAAIQDYCAKVGIEFSEAIARFNYIEHLYQKSIDLFKADLDHYIGMLTQADTSFEELKLLFHTLKSTAPALGFNELGVQAQDFEQALLNAGAVEFELSTYQAFIQQLEINLNKANTLIALLNESKPPTAGHTECTLTDENFNALFSQLKQEIESFNMRAVETFQLINVPLKSLSMDLTDELVRALNKLKFKDAKNLLVQFDLLLNKGNHADQ